MNIEQGVAGGGPASFYSRTSILLCAASFATSFIVAPACVAQQVLLVSYLNPTLVAMGGPQDVNLPERLLPSIKLLLERFEA